MLRKYQVALIVCLMMPMLLCLGAFGRAAGLPDTGQDQCDNGSYILGPCTNANSGDAAPYPRQDGRFGRDAAVAAGALTKIGGGDAGLDYSKVTNAGSVIAGPGAGVPLGSAPTDWACTRDNATGLLWEVKTIDGGLRDRAWTYMWYSTDDTTNGGYPGGLGSNMCNSTLPSGQCNTQAFAAAVNATRLCGYTDWRLPSQRELLTLIHAGRWSPAIDLNYFPDTHAEDSFWSATTAAGSAGTTAWPVFFVDGETHDGRKTSAHLSVRLVRGERF